ncbi:CRISPR-associated endonuclease Cas1 [Roseivirga sp. BDSF3-8]|uniref:CRISPR-associated endonuclease Cas1 n=1 Tax=Roseivirga sp. BDSF3-8 TaxID=3241598 RepID=UPI003531D70F
MHLYLNTYGTYLHIKDQLFEVRVPESEGSKQYQKHHVAAQKVRTIVMTTSAALSTDAIKLAMAHHIDIVFLERGGQPFGRVWHSKPGSTTRIRKRQLEASLSETGLRWVKNWTLRKMQNQADFLFDLLRHRPQLKDSFTEKRERIAELQKSVQELEGDRTADVADSLRGLEGSAGRLYFAGLSEAIPSAWAFKGRSSRPAKDPFNAFLNYAYGILYSRVEKALMVAGLDPYTGFLHRDDYNQLSFVYDFIEPYRIYADTVVFRLFSGKKVNQQHTDELSVGYSLNKEGKQVLVAAFTDYLDEDTIRVLNRNQTRANAMQAEAHGFANSLLEKDDDYETEDY